MDKIIKLNTGAFLTPLEIISNPKGDILHGLKANEDSFEKFGEAYFSKILNGVSKGWKLHKSMTLNIIVPLGIINFHLRSEDENFIDSILLGKNNYARLTVPPRIWMAFSGVGKTENILLNIASIPHDSNEAINQPLEFFPLKNPQGEN